MKRLTITLLALVTMMATASAISYSQAREQALFLTDKMAFELGLTDDQYNAAYEINLDYIMNVDAVGDLYGPYWTRRNNELSYVLTVAQYRAFTATSYFYRPITWTSNRFRFVIYDHYAKGRYFRAAPPGYQTYKGGNRYYDNSPYRGRSFGHSNAAGNVHGNLHGNGHTATPPAGVNPGGGPARKPDTGTMTKKQAVNQGKNNMTNRRH